MQESEFGLDEKVKQRLLVEIQGEMCAAASATPFSHVRPFLPLLRPVLHALGNLQ